MASRESDREGHGVDANGRLTAVAGALILVLAVIETITVPALSRLWS